jgi:hypothetical protein
VEERFSASECWLFRLIIAATFPGGTDGDERYGRGKIAQREILKDLFGRASEGATVVRLTGTKHVSEHADIVLVNYPRGVTAMVWFDLETGAIATSHPGLRDTLRRGCRNWSNRLVFPCDGRPFLSAVYDHFFLSGYAVHWVSLSGFTLAQKETYRV